MGRRALHSEELRRCLLSMVECATGPPLISAFPAGLPHDDRALRQVSPSFDRMINHDTVRLTDQRLCRPPHECRVLRHLSLSLDRVVNNEGSVRRPFLLTE